MLFRSNGSSVTAASAGSNGSAFGGWVNSNNYSASNFTANILDILDYTNTSKYKTVRVLTGNDGNGAGYVFFTSGSWQSTSAINSLNLSLNYDFAQYSQFALYGIRG